MRMPETGMVMLRVRGEWPGAEAVMVAARGAGATGIWREYLPAGLERLLVNG